MIKTSVVIWLVLTFDFGSGAAVEKIPQTNMAQCVANLKQYSKKVRTLDGANHAYSVRAHCIAGSPLPVVEIEK